MATGADFSISDVLAWARTKPADEAYDYEQPDNCALCQFLRETHRIANPSVTSLSYRNKDTDEHFELPALADAAAIGEGGRCHDNISERWTFGRLVKRLEALCPETPVTKSDWLAIDAYMADIETVEA